MKHSAPMLLLAVLLLLLGMAVVKVTVGGVRSSTAAEPEPERTVARPPPAEESDPPLLAGRGAADSAGDVVALRASLETLRASLEALRAERDRLAAELAALQESAKRWEALAELEKLQRTANELAALATSRNAVSAQAQIQAAARIDVDRDATGEYGGFLEMSGGAAGRISGGRPMVPPVLSGAFRTLTADGEAYRNGYLYRIYLPDRRGNGVGEGPEGFSASQVDPDLAETTWCLYAWPAVGGISGRRTFFVNQGGDVFAAEETRYAGPGQGPSPDAAFTQPGILGVPGGRGNDGSTWKQVN